MYGNFEGYRYGRLLPFLEIWAFSVLEAIKSRGAGSLY